MNPQIVTVNLIPGLSTPAVVRVSQYDVERPITFRVLDGNKAAVFPDDCTATIEATKPSGLGFSLLGTIAPGGIVNFTTAMSVTQECGMFPAEIRFSTNAYGSFPATDIGTANFILAVEPSPHPEGTTDGTQETMQNLETRLQSEINDLSDRIDDIEAGGSGLSQTEKNLILTLFSKAAYAESDAESAYDALENLWTTTTRTITYNLSHVSSSNTTASIEQGQSYTTTLTATGSYTLNSVTVTMGGVDITSTAYSSGTVSIPSVTGNIVITATAVRNPLPSGYTAYDFVQNLQTGNNCAVSTGLDYTYGASNYEHEFVFKLVTGGNTGGIFGLRATTGTTNNSLTAWINGDGTSNLAINAASSDTGYTLTASKNVKNTIKITHASGNTKVYFNESLVIDAVDASFTVSENKYFHLFKAFTASSSSSGSATSKIKVYEYSVKNISTGDYVAKMIPCVEDSTSNAGFYDIVRNAFYTSSSTGQLQAGND